MLVTAGFRPQDRLLYLEYVCDGLAESLRRPPEVLRKGERSTGDGAHGRFLASYQLRERLPTCRSPDSVSVPDLIIAAIAESAGIVVLRNDKDSNLIADITGQPVQRLDG